MRTGIVALAAVLALGCRAASAAAEQQVISNPAGPLTSIFIENDLACQVQASGDEAPSFFGGTEPGGCATVLALRGGPTEPHTFGPTEEETKGRNPVPPGIYFEAEYTPNVQTITGEGTSANPRTVFTKVYVERGGKTVAELTEEDAYVYGSDSYKTTVTVTRIAAEPLEGTLYHVGDCFLANLDTGYGAADVPSAGSVACTITPNDSPAERYMAFTPLTAGSSYVESAYPTFWEDITSEGAPLPDTVDTSANQDNGMGLSWPISLPVGTPTTQTLSFSTTVSPSSPPTSSSSAGACVPSGQVPVTVSAVNGAKAVDYRVDGGAVQAVAASISGQATISLTPGQHTLEYWGEDLTGAQESTHHVIAVTVASGGPALTITSDQHRSGYEVGEKGSVTITATGPGLTSNPSATGVPIATGTPGTFSVARSAANACGTTSATFTYTVIPPPVLGKTANVDPVSGKVYVALPGGASASIASSLEAATEALAKGLKFIPLTEARQVPVGSTLETTAGVARLTTATSSKGKLQSGEFGAGIFKLLQNRKQKGLTELNIINNRSTKQVCASIGKKAQAASKKLSSKTLGRLTGSAHGKFTTKGTYSAATVRGTSWGVINQCDGTLTKVTRGKVSVRDFRRRKTITLFSGQHYLAKAPL